MALRNNEKRNEILTSSYGFFSLKPYDDVLLIDIAKDSGINKSLLQHYYSKKSDIMKALLDELLSQSYLYMDLLPYTYENEFQKISDFDMLFFRAASVNPKLERFILSSVGQQELIILWIESICSWLRNLCGEATFTYLQLRIAIDFSMAGSMHLYCQKDQLGIDYRFICQNHIHSIMNLLHFPEEIIHGITQQTEQRCAEFNVEQFLNYCEEKISWFSC